MPTYLDAYKRHTRGNASAMVLNSTFGYYCHKKMDYIMKVEKIYSYKIERNGGDERVSANADVFNIYVSRIDTYGPVTSVSRSRCQYHHDGQSEDQASPIDNDTTGCLCTDADGGNSKI